jgi:hypothetical protein
MKSMWTLIVAGVFTLALAVPAYAANGVCDGTGSKSGICDGAGPKGKQQRKGDSAQNGGAQAGDRKADQKRDRKRDGSGK